MDDAHSYQEQGYDFRISHYRLPSDRAMWFDPPEFYENRVEFMLDNVRRFFRRGENDFVPFERGGMTICEVTKNKQFEFDTSAVCSLQDNFSYKRGTKIALGRALKVLSAERQER